MFAASMVEFRDHFRGGDHFEGARLANTPVGVPVSQHVLVFGQRIKVRGILKIPNRQESDSSSEAAVYVPGSGSRTGHAHHGSTQTARVVREQKVLPADFASPKHPDDA
jgi:hypothetical protein